MDNMNFNAEEALKNIKKSKNLPDSTFDRILFDFLDCIKKSSEQGLSTTKISCFNLVGKEQERQFIVRMKEQLNKRGFVVGIDGQFMVVSVPDQDHHESKDGDLWDSIIDIINRLEKDYCESIKTKIERE